jgi:catechol 2,3-dioxygenase-like lactoylglutathione lyase family enzyme
MIAGMNHITLAVQDINKSFEFYRDQVLTKLLKNCGFKSVRVVKAFDSTAAPDENDESIVYECRKF